VDPLRRLLELVVSVWTVTPDGLIGHTVEKDRLRRALEEERERQDYGVPFDTEVRRRARLIAPTVLNPGDYRSRYMRTVSERAAVWR